jgi:ABC-type multidrug transport system permease subunit
MIKSCAQEGCKIFMAITAFFCAYVYMCGWYRRQTHNFRELTLMATTARLDIAGMIHPETNE